MEVSSPILEERGAAMTYYAETVRERERMGVV
jgi:hypothetical protein